MAVNPLNAFVGSPPIDGGVLYAADLDVANPADASTDLPSGYKDHGAVGPDGFTLRPSRSNTTEKRHGGQDWIDLQTESGMEVEFQLLEDDNDAVLETIFGAANVKKTDATSSDGTKRTIYHTVEQLPLRKYVLNAQYGGKLKRYGALLARVSNVAEIQNTHSASTKYTVTLRCLVPSDEDLQGAYVVEFRDDGSVLADGKPVIDSISPVSIPLAGGLVQVIGHRFTGATAVTIDGAGVEFSIVNANTIVVEAPADTAGTVPMVVTNASGASVAFSVTYA